MPTSTTPEFAVGEAVIGIHPGSEYLGQVGEVTRVHENYNNTPGAIRYEVTWAGASEPKLYRPLSLGAAPRALSRVPSSTKTFRRGRKAHRTRCFTLSPTPRRDAAIQVRKPGPRDPV